MTRFGTMGACLLAGLIALTPRAGRAQGVYVRPPQPAARLADPIRLLRTGKYDAAITALQAIPRADSAWPDAQIPLALALSAVGRYDDAERVARGAAQSPQGKNAWNTYGEILRARGKRVPAESAFARAVALQATDSLTATLNLAILTYEGGEHNDALDAFDRFIDVYNKSSSTLTSAELADVGVAVEYLSVRNPDLDQDAQTAFNRALRVDPDNIDAKVLLAELYLEKYNGRDAKAEFDEVLRTDSVLPRALVGAARRAAADHQAGADSLIAAALEVNPDYVPALLFAAQGLLGAEEYTEAEREVEHALRIDPSSSDALGLLAAMQYLAGNRTGFEATRQRAIALNPHDGAFYLTMAEMADNVHSYSAAIDFARQAIAADSTDWAAFGKLGMELFRMGKVAEAKQNLDRAFAGDPYNVWFKNTLDLMDTYTNYVETATPHFQFVMPRDEADVMGLYVDDLAERAYATFAAEFGYQPPPPVRLELYETNADFSVRTLGLPGIDAVGVSFGPTSVFVSPVARHDYVEAFNWGSVMWHELAHTFTLGLSEYKVPRWLTEGLSVYEEHRGRPGWGMGVTPAFLEAFKKGKLPPLSRMNDGFMNPKEVMHAYYEASLFCDMVEHDEGTAGLTAMLQGYRDGLSTAQVVKKVLGLDPAAADKKFSSYIAQRFAGPLAALVQDSASVDPAMSNEEIIRRARTTDQNSFVREMTAGETLLDRGDTANALTALTRAAQLFPDDAGPDGPDGVLIQVYTALGDIPRLIATLRHSVSLAGNDYEAHVALGDLLETAGDTAGAADMLDRAMYIDPFDPVTHQTLADLYQRLGDKQKVIRERRAIVALRPSDLAGAWYRLAVAYDDAKDVPNARHAVLRSLEEAPHYQLAQELLLKLHGE